jgi:hypothetical protein
MGKKNLGTLVSEGLSLHSKKGGIYMIGTESDSLVFGYDASDPIKALSDLKRKGYLGRVKILDISKN